MSHTVRIVSEQRPDLLSWIGDAGGVLSTNSVEILLTGFQTRHLKRNTVMMMMMMMIRQLRDKKLKISKR